MQIDLLYYLYYFKILITNVLKKLYFLVNIELNQKLIILKYYIGILYIMNFVLIY